MSASTAHTIARWTLRVLAVVVVLVLTGVGVVYGLSERRLRARSRRPTTRSPRATTAQPSRGGSIS